MTNNFKHFAIILDDEKKEKNASLLKRLINSVSEKLGVKKRPTQRSFIKMMEQQLSYKDAITINEHLELSYVPRIKKAVKISSDTNKYFLMRDFDKLVELLSEFCEEPKKREKQYEIEITIERPKTKKIRKVTTYDKITILERWVKIGYKMYRRQFDSFSGDEYIVVDGDVYDIKYDRYGREYLA
jgi:hypothetical protein